MIDVKLFDARELDEHEWLQMQHILREGSKALMDDRPADEIDSYVSWDDPRGFYLSHEDPNIEVGKAFAGDQTFSHPKIAIAKAAGEPVGYLYVANNVSGATPQERRHKQLSVVRNYRWIREVAVLPGAQHHGIARHLGRHTMLHSFPLQPVSTYIYPSVVPFLQEKLEAAGFYETGSQEAYPFGEDHDPVDMVRMQANSAIGVLARMYAHEVRNITVDYS